MKLTTVVQKIKLVAELIIAMKMIGGLIFSLAFPLLLVISPDALGQLNSSCGTLVHCTLEGITRAVTGNLI